MMHALRFFESFLLWQNLRRKNAKNRFNLSQKRATYSPCDTSETKHSRNIEIGTNIAHGVRMMPEPFVFQ